MCDCLTFEQTHYRQVYLLIVYLNCGIVVQRWESCETKDLNVLLFITFGWMWQLVKFVRLNDWLNCMCSLSFDIMREEFLFYLQHWFHLFFAFQCVSFRRFYTLNNSTQMQHFSFIPNRLIRAYKWLIFNTHFGHSKLNVN